MNSETGTSTVLIVDDDHGLRSLIERRLLAEGFRTAGVATGAEAIEWLTARGADIMLLDLKLPDTSAGDLLAELSRRNVAVPFIVITGQGDERVAVDMMKRGARDYLTKDMAFLELLPSVVGRVLEQAEQERRLAQAEASLEESRRMLARLFSNLGGVVYRCRNDKKWTMEFLSDGCQSLTGYRAEDIVDNRIISYGQVIHPDDRERVWSEVQEGLRKNEPFRMMYRITTVDGREKWVWEQGRGVFGPGGEVVALEGFITDITDYRRAQEALAESEERFRQLAENIQEMFWVLTPADGRLLYVSPAYEKIFGRSCDALYADPQSLLESIHPADRDRASALVSGRDHAVRDEEYRIVRADGSLRWISASTFPVSNETGEAYRIVGVARDITDRKQAEEQLRHAHKMEAVGTLASGVAHDFNNLLTAILGYTTLARKTLHKNHPANQSLEMVESAVQQAGGVAKALLTFSHKTATEKAPVNLCTVVADSLRLLRRVLPASVEITDDVPARSEVWVNADATQLQQVLMNLAVNARDAMPDGGHLYISLRKAPPSASRTRSRRGGPAMPRAVLVIQDTGMGMPEDVRLRVFEPFFTTKPRGQGTGLGMSIVHGIITDHGGRIRIESEPNRGTRVVITLPQCEPLTPATTSAPETRRKHGRGEAILVVEDDAHIRSIVTSALRSEGYEVYQAADGVEAMSVLETHAATIRLLVLDIDLPRLSGLAYLERVRQKGLQLPAVLVTGSVETELHEPAADNTQLLRKPFRMSELATVVAHMLNQHTQKEEVLSHERHDPHPGR